MKKPEFLKRVLAGTLGFMLVFSDAVPAMAAETQPAENVMEAEAVEGQEDVAVSEDGQEEALQEEAGTPETEAEEVQTESQASKTEAPEAEAENQAPEAEVENQALEAEAENQAPETETEEDQTENQASETEPGIVQTEVIEEDKLYAAEDGAVVPSITRPEIRVDDEGSYSYIYLSYTGTNCEYVELEVKASNTGSIVYKSESYGSNYSIDTDTFYDDKTKKADLSSGVTYTFTLKPYTYDDNYSKVYGTAVSVTWNAPTVGAVQGLAVEEETSYGFVFSHKAVPEDVSVRYEYSNSKTFSDKATQSGSFYGTLDYDELTPGVKYYVRAYMMKYGVQGAYSNVVQVSAPVADVGSISTEIFDKAITLKMSASYGSYTGFQVDRKNGKKYQNLTTTAQHRFKDTGLKKNTKYVYRVRAYYYNSDTKKYVYGAYSYKTVQTGTAALNLRVQASGNSAVKLTWKKVADAAGYDVYKSVGYSDSSTYKSGENYNFTKYELVKSLGKKAKSYTDKKLLAENYSYIVRAYKKVKGKKVYFTEDSDSVTLKFSVNSSVNIYKQVQNVKNGKVTASWYPVPQAKGYLIEKYDSAKEEWVTQKKITKAKTTSYTFPASPLGETVQYRIRAYSGKKYSSGYGGSVNVTGYIAAVTGVKAKATSKGIQVSWKKVAGASYYRVYRTADPMETYDADTKTYDYENEESVQIRAYKEADKDDKYYYTLGNGKTKMQYDSEAAQKLMYKSPYSDDDYYSSSAVKGTSVTDYVYSEHEPKYNDKDVIVGENVEEYGPKRDVVYYYYVVAYKETKDSKTSVVREGRSYGDSKAASAVMAGDAKKVPAIKKAKAGKKSVTLSIKKVKGVKKYLIYRSTSKKKGYQLVGSTTKTSYKDTKLKSKKTYYYKIKAVSSNGLGVDTESSFSSVKSAKAK